MKILARCNTEEVRIFLNILSHGNDDPHQCPLRLTVLSREYILKLADGADNPDVESAKRLEAKAAERFNRTYKGR
jgi:hypothetical protein